MLRAPQDGAALARAFRWRRMLATGRYAAIDELAAAEKITASYVSRILLMGPFAVEWDRQRLER